MSDRVEVVVGTVLGERRVEFVGMGFLKLKNDLTDDVVAKVREQYPIDDLPEGTTVAAILHDDGEHVGTEWYDVTEADE